MSAMCTYIIQKCDIVLLSLTNIFRNICDQFRKLQGKSVIIKCVIIIFVVCFCSLLVPLSKRSDQQGALTSCLEINTVCIRVS